MLPTKPVEGGDATEISELVEAAAFVRRRRLAGYPVTGDRLDIAEFEAVLLLDAEFQSMNDRFKIQQHETFALIQAFLGKK